MLPTKAAIINDTATTTEIPRALSGLGSFFLLNFNNKFQIPNNPITARKENV